MMICFTFTSNYNIIQKCN